MHGLDVRADNRVVKSRRKAVTGCQEGKKVREAAAESRGRETGRQAGTGKLFRDAFTPGSVWHIIKS
jgi:hypothetical protein